MLRADPLLMAGHTAVGRALAMVNGRVGAKVPVAEPGNIQHRVGSGKNPRVIIMSAEDSLRLLQAHIGMDERLEWSEQPGPIAPGKSEQQFAIGIALLSAFIATTLMGVEGVAAGLGLLLPFTLAFLVVWAGLTLLGRNLGRRSRAYGITDKRLIIVVADEMLEFGPGDIWQITVDQHKDGTFDVFWGTRGLYRGERSREGGGAKTRQQIQSRSNRLGFIGLNTLEPAQSLLQDWLRRHALGASTLGYDGADSLPATLMSTASNGDSRILTETQTGFQIALPANWQARVGRVKRGRFLGLRFEGPEPDWMEESAVGWNRLEVTTGLSNATLRVDLDPDGVPASLEAARSSVVSKLVQMEVVDTRPDVRINDISGFGLSHRLSGSHIDNKANRSIKVDLIQSQLWLSGSGHVVHILFSIPPHADAVREAVECAIATIQFKPGSRP